MIVRRRSIAWQGIQKSGGGTRKRKRGFVYFYQKTATVGVSFEKRVKGL